MGAAIAKSQPKKGRRRRRAQPMAEINVTPFVDVMLVLLIIFMVAAPMLTVGVSSPAAKNGGQCFGIRTRRAVDNFNDCRWRNCNSKHACGT